MFVLSLEGYVRIFLWRIFGIGRMVNVIGILGVEGSLGVWGNRDSFEVRGLVRSYCNSFS